MGVAVLNIFARDINASSCVVLILLIGLLVLDSVEHTLNPVRRESLNL